MPRPKILIVEDEVIAARALATLLDFLGYETCSIAFSGEKATQVAEAERPDIVLMDVHLKGEMDGVETGKKIKALHGTPVVFMTGYTDEETIQWMESIGPAAYLIKPLEIAELKQALEKALQGRSGR